MATTDPVKVPQAPTESSPRTHSAAAGSMRRNVILFILDTAFFFFALSLLDSTSVIPSLFGHLTSRPVFIGLLGSVQSACWLLPQLLVARVVAGLSRKLPLVILATSLSRLSWVILLAALFFPGGLSPTVILIAAYITLGLFWTFDGIAVLAWYDVIARAVPATLRGRMFGLMSLSGIFAVVGGVVVQRVLGSVELPYPADYRLLLILAIVAFAVGVVPLCFVNEPPAEEPTRPAEPLGDYLRRLPGLLRDRPTFRRLVAIQLLVGLSSLAVPFYTPFGISGLGLPESSVGIFVIGLTVGSMVGGFAWGYLGDHGRKDAAIRAIAAIGLLAPLVAILLRVFSPVLPANLLAPLLALSLFFVGCSTRSNWVAFANYIMEISEPHERPILIGLMNTLNGTLALAPPLGGLLAGWFGYEATFAVATLPIAAGLILSIGLRLPPSPTVRAAA